MPTKKPSVIQQFQEEFKMYMYLWPGVLGEDRTKWERVHEVVDKTARRHHKDNCCGLAADGRTSMGSPAYETCHYPHASSVEMSLLKLVETGIPAFLCEEG